MSQICNMFNNETNELTQAIDNIDNSRFTITSNSEIPTRWVFQNKFELYAWLYDYYNEKPDPTKSRQVDIFRGKMLEKSPLSILDPLAFTQLSLDLFRAVPCKTDNPRLRSAL